MFNRFGRGGRRKRNFDPVKVGTVYPIAEGAINPNAGAANVLSLVPYNGLNAAKLNAVVFKRNIAAPVINAQTAMGFRMTGSLSPINDPQNPQLQPLAGQVPTVASAGVLLVQHRNGFPINDPGSISPTGNIFNQIYSPPEELILSTQGGVIGGQNAVESWPVMLETRIRRKLKTGDTIAVVAFTVNRNLPVQLSLQVITFFTT